MKNPTPVKSLFLISALFIALFSLTIISGCKKDDNKQSATCTNGIKDGTETDIDCGGDCNVCTATYRIKTVVSIDYNGDTTSSRAYTYDNTGRLTYMFEEQPTAIRRRFYYYTNDSIVYIDSASGGRKVYMLNAQGYAASETHYTSSSQVFTYNYTYDAQGHLINLNNTAYTWANNNLITRGDGYIYSYYTDKLNTIGNEKEGLRFLGISSRNLIQKIDVGGISITPTYQFDGLGRIIYRDDNFSFKEYYTYY